MAYKSIPSKFDFNTIFETWIIAYCLDTDSWFCTNERFFFYEYEKEFETENEGINYFENNIQEFIKINNMIRKSTSNSVFLDNTMKHYSLTLN